MQHRAANSAPSVLMFGTRGLLSRSVAEGLLARGVTLDGIVVPAQSDQPSVTLPAPVILQGDLPMVASYVEHSIVELGWRASIPVWAVSTRGDYIARLIETLAPEIVVVACWPSLISHTALQLPRWGFVNVHPSMLPAFRGPAPLFWQLREGLRESGVTVHRMSELLDKGAILNQASLPLATGATGPALDYEAGRLGARLVWEVLEQCRRGALAESQQEPGAGSYQSWPVGADFEVPTTWSALHAWNFMRGTAEWAIPHTIVLPEFRFMVEEVVGFDPEEKLDVPVTFRGDLAGVRFDPGVVWGRGAWDAPP